MEDLDIKIVAQEAILEFESVINKYNELQQKLTGEEKKRKLFEAQFKQLKQASLLAITEYESLHKQYIEENNYRLKVEKNLEAVKNENSEIRKQHSISRTATIVSSDITTGGNQGTKGELELLRSLNKAVNEELRNTKSELTSVKDQLNQEKDAHENLKKNMTMHIEQNRQLNRVSVLALSEYNDLKKKYEIEVELRREAEDLATKLVAEKKLDERKSRMVSVYVENDNQLDTYMKEIEELNAASEQYRIESEKKIKELEEQLVSSQDTESIKSLEEKLAVVMDQLDLAQKQLVSAEERFNKAEENSRQLYVRLAESERGRTSSVVLPPPPPPPPPPIAAPVIRKFITRIGKKKKDGNAVVIEQEEDPRIQAMAEMMERIKKGVGLRPVNSGSKDKENDDGSAMNELAGLLDKMKKGRSDSRENLTSDESEKQPEFAMVKLKKSSKPSFDKAESKDNTSSELKKKLEKQKSVAEGLEESPLTMKKKPVPPPVPTKSRSGSKLDAESNESLKVATSTDNLSEPHKEDSTKDSIPKENTKVESNDKTETSNEKSLQEQDIESKVESGKVESEGEKESDEIAESKITLQDDKESNNNGSIDSENNKATMENVSKDTSEETVQTNSTPSENKDRKDSGNWEIEMVIDATGRQSTDKETNEMDSSELSKRELRKSVDEVFDGLLNDLTTSIDPSGEKKE